MSESVAIVDRLLVSVPNTERWIGEAVIAMRGLRLENARLTDRLNGHGEAKAEAHRIGELSAQVDTLIRAGQVLEAERNKLREELAELQGRFREAEAEISRLHEAFRSMLEFKAYVSPTAPDADLQLADFARCVARYVLAKKGGTDGPAHDGG